MFSIVLLKFLFSGLFILSVAHGNPWFEIESQIYAKKKKLDEVNLAIRNKMKPQFKKPSESEEAEFVFEFSSLREERLILEKEIEKLTQELKYRFPERGLKVDSPEDKGASKVLDLPIENEKKEDSRVNENAVDQTMKAIRRQFGTPLTGEEIQKLKESALPKDNAIMKKPAKNPIDQKIIISK